MQNKSLIRIGIVDDHPMIRRCLINDISQDTDLKVEFDVSSFDELRESLTEYNPVIILLDLVLKKDKYDGRYIAKYLSEKHPHIKKIMITDYYEVIIEENLKNLYINSCISKADATGKKLISLIHNVNDSDKFVYVDTEIQTESKMTKIGDIKFSLTKIRILEYLLTGYKQIEIASFLDLQEQTINKHVSEIKQKLDAKTTTEMILKAQNIGFV